MNYYIITGASKGIGKALAEHLLQDDKNRVIGVSRNCTITHPNYHHQPLDMSDIAAVENNLHKIFQLYPDATKLVLVNNAGVLGEIGYMGEQKNEEFEYVFDVNVIVPAMLMNTFLAHYQQQNCEKIILNISSGAGKYPVDGWAAYCASKAALDMLSLTAQKEQEIRGYTTRIFSLAPGVVDTAMQEHIREADPNHFASVQKFVEYKEKGDLQAPEEVAEKIGQLLAKPDKYEAIILRIDEIKK